MTKINRLNQPATQTTPDNEQKLNSILIDAYRETSIRTYHEDDQQ